MARSDLKMVQNFKIRSSFDYVNLHRYHKSCNILPLIGNQFRQACPICRTSKTFKSILQTQVPSSDDDDDDYDGDDYDDNDKELPNIY